MNQYDLERAAGALIDTQCPRCGLFTGALINNTDTPWQDIECPGCGNEWTEQL